MIAADQAAAIGQAIVAGVAEGVILEFQVICAQHGLMCDLAQCQDAGVCGQLGQFGGEKAIALADFARLGLVGGRQAFHRVGDAAIDELQTVVDRHRFRCAGVAELMQGLIQQDAGGVAGEGAAAAVGAVHAGREADDQKLGVRVAKRRHRPGMVGGIAGVDVIQKRGEARAGTAVGIEIHGVVRALRFLLGRSQTRCA